MEGERLPASQCLQAHDLFYKGVGCPAQTRCGSVMPLAATSLRLGDETVPVPGSVPEASLGRQPLGKVLWRLLWVDTGETLQSGGCPRRGSVSGLAVKAKLMVLEALTRGLASRSGWGPQGE